MGWPPSSARSGRPNPSLIGPSIPRPGGNLRRGAGYLPEHSPSPRTGYTELESGYAAGLPRLAKPFNEFDLAREIARVFPPKPAGGGARVLRFRAGPSS